MIESLQSEMLELKNSSHGMSNITDIATNGHNPLESSKEIQKLLAEIENNKKIIEEFQGSTMKPNGVTPDLEDLIDNMTMKIKKLETQLSASKKQESNQLQLNKQLESDKVQLKDIISNFESEVDALTNRCEELENGIRSLIETSERQEMKITELSEENDELKEKLHPNVNNTHLITRMKDLEELVNSLKGL